jgi:Rieske Fe-S protein
MTDQDVASAPVPTPRRTILKGAAAACAAVPFLAACGNGSSSNSGSDLRKPEQGGGSSSAGGTSSGGGNPNGGGAGGQSANVITTTSKVPQGGGIIVDSPGIVITQPQAGTFKGFSNVCTHMGCTVGDVSGGTINCPCHGSQFSIEDGSVVTGPAVTPLPTEPITVKGSDILAG